MKQNQIFPFNNYGQYLRDKYGCTAYRVGVDAGFSCPNRNGTLGDQGCLYCDATGARAPYLDNRKNLGEQIDRSLGFLKKRYGAEVFILYFQAYTNTLASVDELKNLYDDALAHADFREFIISTRPDCLDEATLDLIASYRNEHREVWIELGLQSSHNSSLGRVNRGHGVDEFRDAFLRIRKAGLKQVVHLIFGLPGEDWDMIQQTVELMAELKPEGIKIHNLHIPRQAPLYNQFAMGAFTFPGKNRHLEYVVKALCLLPPEIIIMRLTCDTPRERDKIPGNMPSKSHFYNEVRDVMNNSGLFQGCSLKK